jgi:hypothetical protein
MDELEQRLTEKMTGMLEAFIAEVRTTPQGTIAATNHVQQPSYFQRPNVRRDSRVCYYCNQVGHVQRFCSIRAQQSQRQGQGPNYGQSYGRRYSSGFNATTNSPNYGMQFPQFNGGYQYYSGPQNVQQTAQQNASQFNGGCQYYSAPQNAQHIVQQGAPQNMTDRRAASQSPHRGRSHIRNRTPTK